LIPLRKVDHHELVSQAVSADKTWQQLDTSQANSLGEQNPDELFGISLERASSSTVTAAKKKKKNR